MNRRLLAAGVLCSVGCACVQAADTWHEIRLEGRLHTSDPMRPATLRVFCDAAPNRGIGLELIVPEVASHPDFDYADFEGPDAAARDRKLSRVSIAGSSGKNEIVRAASGWYAIKPQGAFVFGINSATVFIPGRDDPNTAAQARPVHSVAQPDAGTANFFAALDAERGHIVWVQTAFDSSRRELRAAFDYDAATARQLRDAVAPCLAATATK